MDVCLGLGLGETMLTLVQSRMNNHGTLAEDNAEKSRGSNFSWSFVSRCTLQSPSGSACSENPSGDGPLCETSSVLGACSDKSTSDGLQCEASSHSGVSDLSSRDSSSSGACSNKSVSPHSQLKRLTRGPGKRKGRKPVLLEKVPFGKSSKYLTVYVGIRSELSVKYVISRKLLTHPLLQVLLKCSEDEFGEDYSVKRGVAIVCDPALFMEVIRAVDEDLYSAENVADES